MQRYCIDRKPLKYVIGNICFLFIQYCDFAFSAFQILFIFNTETEIILIFNNFKSMYCKSVNVICTAI